jgi:predicted nucleic acid-binding protein
VILIDTSVLSRVFRRRRLGAEERRLQHVLKELMESEAPLGLPGIVLQEVLSGIASEKQFTDLRTKLLAAFSIVPATAQDHVDAARLKNHCARKGLNASGIDCLIAASAIAGDHILFARDEDFEAISKLAPLRLLQQGDVA